MFIISPRVKSSKDGLGADDGVGGVAPMLADLEEHIYQTGINDMVETAEVITQVGRTILSRHSFVASKREMRELSNCIVNLVGKKNDGNS